MRKARCRFCGAELSVVFADLGMAPPSNSYLSEDQLNAMERYYPLRAFVCGECLLVQLEEFETPRQIFSDYAYFSSYSESWLRHCEAYVGMMCSRFGFDARSKVIEIASNDGYLLQYFKRRGVDVLGIEPAENVARVAMEQREILTRCEFFGAACAAKLVEEGIRPDLLLGNNVLAHVPDINDFVAGMQILLPPEGIITMEFPHLLRLIEEVQFDTIYHEHFSYLSLTTAERIFAKHGLRIFDAQSLPTHGGSIRIFAAHESSSRKGEGSVKAMLKKERNRDLLNLETYQKFNQRVFQVKRGLLEFLIGAKASRQRIAAYGAAAKGNTLLNYCGVGREFIDFVADRSPHKQGKFMPGSHIAILSPDAVAEFRPDYLLILPWNIRDEVMEQMAHIRGWGGQFVTAIPSVQVL